jgi:Methyltransferase domain
MLTCPICKTKYDRVDLKKFESDCIFSPIEGINQHLIRYQCLNCDVIFGPEDMLNLSASQLGKAYQDLYKSGNREGDSTHVEVSLFNRLNPTSNGTYVNWGAGTNHTSIEIAKQGYKLLNYDPGIPNNVTGYITINEIKQSKFDGIFSNNVLDHLQDPVSDLMLMKSLLKPGAKMIHASDGFKYKIDFTKFHLYFFIGRSVQYLSQIIEMKMTFIPNIRFSNEIDATFDILILE